MTNNTAGVQLPCDHLPWGLPWPRTPTGAEEKPQRADPSALDFRPEGLVKGLVVSGEFGEECWDARQWFGNRDLSLHKGRLGAERPENSNSTLIRCHAIECSLNEG